VDAIEQLRPAIDAKVFAFVEAHEFARRDFPQSGYKVHRLSRDVTQLLLHKASLPAREIEEAAEWMVQMILNSVRFATNANTMGDWKGRPAHRSSDQTWSDETLRSPLVRPSGSNRTELTGATGPLRARQAARRLRHRVHRLQPAPVAAIHGHGPRF
jgi:hypothetical protein